MPEIVRYQDDERFYGDVESYLITHEVVHNLFFGVLDARIKFPERFVDRPAYLAAVQHHGKVAGVVLQNPPYKLDLSILALEGEALQAAMIQLAEGYHGEGRTLPGVHGVRESVEPFMAAWQSLTGEDFELEMNQGLYRLEKVSMPEGVPGTMRRARADDFDRLVEWQMGFGREALGTADREQAQASIEAMLSTDMPGRGLHVWEVDGQMVSSANATGPTPNGMRINFVYTPPEHRRRGYASAVTASLSQYVLDSGRRFCCLFTDMGNPTSNHIYQEIGYRAVTEIELYRVVS